VTGDTKEELTFGREAKINELIVRIRKRLACWLDGGERYKLSEYPWYYERCLTELSEQELFPSIIIMRQMPRDDGGPVILLTLTFKEELEAKHAEEMSLVQLKFGGGRTPNLEKGEYLWDFAYKKSCAVLGRSPKAVRLNGIPGISFPQTNCSTYRTHKNEHAAQDCFLPTSSDPKDELLEKYEYLLLACMPAFGSGVPGIKVVALLGSPTDHCSLSEKVLDVLLDLGMVVAEAITYGADPHSPELRELIPLALVDHVLRNLESERAKEMVLETINSSGEQSLWRKAGLLTRHAFRLIRDKAGRSNGTERVRALLSKQRSADWIELLAYARSFSQGARSEDLLPPRIDLTSNEVASALGDLRPNSFFWYVDLLPSLTAASQTELIKQLSTAVRHHSDLHPRTLRAIFDAALVAIRFAPTRESSLELLKVTREALEKVYEDFPESVLAIQETTILASRNSNVDVNDRSDDRRLAAIAGPGKESTQRGKSAMPTKLILVASQKGGVGKTGLAMSLGIGLGETKRTLLMELDFAGPTLGYLPGAVGHPTIQDVLAGKRLNESLWTPGVGQFHIIPGAVSQTTREESSKRLLGVRGLQGLAQQMREYLKSSRGKYDAILIDLPAEFHLQTPAAFSLFQGYSAPVLLLVARPDFNSLWPLLSWPTSYAKPQGARIGLVFNRVFPQLHSLLSDKEGVANYLFTKSERLDEAARPSSPVAIDSLAPWDWVCCVPDVPPLRQAATIDDFTRAASDPSIIALLNQVLETT
jgi:MinD-like ATPase involved in chromosome partitioning or flagellar assembly